jgi:hypothetical protein
VLESISLPFARSRARRCPSTFSASRGEHQPSERGLVARARQGRAPRKRGGLHVPPHPRDVPGAVRLPGDAADAGGLLDGGVGDAEAACELAGGGDGIRHDGPPCRADWQPDAAHALLILQRFQSLVCANAVAKAGNGNLVSRPGASDVARFRPPHTPDPGRNHAPTSSKR